MHESYGERSTDKSNHVELVNNPPTTTFRFFEYNGMSVASSHVDEEPELPLTYCAANL